MGGKSKYPTICNHCLKHPGQIDQCETPGTCIDLIDSYEAGWKDATESKFDKVPTLKDKILGILREWL